MGHLSRQLTHVSDLERTSPEDQHVPLHLPPARLKKKKLSSKAASADQAQGKTPQVSTSTSISAPMYRPGMSSPPDYEPANEQVDEGLEELTPLSHPEQGLRDALKTLKDGGDDWELRCVCLVNIRRLAAYHRQLVVGQLHSVIRAVDKEVCMR